MGWFVTLVSNIERIKLGFYILGMVGLAILGHYAT